MVCRRYHARCPLTLFPRSVDSVSRSFWNQVGWDIRVYLPTFIYIGSHVLGPFLLNPVIMRGYY